MWMPMTLGALDSGLMLLLGALCLVIFSISAARRAYYRSTSKRDMTRAHFARIRDQHQIRDSMDDLLVQLEEASRRINAQIETRMMKLEVLIRDADDRLNRLQAVQGGNGATVAAAIAPPADRGRGVSSGADAFEPGLQPAVKPAAPAPTANVESAESAVPQTRAERFQRIYALADKGTHALAIADALGIPLGEIELILNLRKAKPAGDSGA